LKDDREFQWAWKKTLKHPELWAEFHECIHIREFTVHVRCKHCPQLYQHPNTIGKAAEAGTTRSLSRHLSNCPIYSKQKSQPSMDRFMQQRDDGQTSFNSFSNDKMIDKALKFFISGNIAFNQADNPYFQELVCHGITKRTGTAINRKSLREHLKTVGTAAKESLLVTLMENDSKISLALDCWTSANGHAFLGTISVAYISALYCLNLLICMLHVLTYVKYTAN